MREILEQLGKIVKRASFKQKMIASGVMLFLCLFLLWNFSHAKSARFTTLYPHLTAEQERDVIAKLEEMNVSYKKKNGVLVPKNQLDSIKGQLNSALQLEEKKEGFELFDTNTWIKGERELQVLEMRALKGQLERDLAGFEKIKSASVILDLAQPRAFGGAQQKTKASVILTLRTGAHLRPSELKAITYHLVGAVRGLEPVNVAISDTKGRLYQAAGESEVIIEEQLKGEIEELLDKVVGKQSYHLSLQLLEKKLVVALVLDKELAAALREEELGKQLEMIAKAYAEEIEMRIDFIPFAKKREHFVEPKEKRGEINTIIFASVVTITLALLFYLLIKRRGPSSEKLLSSMMTTVDVEKLAQSMREEDPKTIAHMLSHLEVAAAEKMLEAFPPQIQEEILAHLESE